MRTADWWGASRPGAYRARRLAAAADLDAPQERQFRAPTPGAARQIGTPEQFAMLENRRLDAIDLRAMPASTLHRFRTVAVLRFPPI
jgi:hypothetical protein